MTLHTNTCTGDVLLSPGAVLSAKAQLDQQLQESRHHTRHIITALHKAQDKIDLLEVRTVHVHVYMYNMYMYMYIAQW